MAKIMRNVVLLAKIESGSPGTDSLPAQGTDAMLAQVTNPQPVVAEFVDRNIVRPYFGNSGKVQVSSRSEIEIEVELASSGAAGTKPAWSPLMQACAFGETNAPGVSTTYAPASTSLKTCTIYYYLDGLLHKMLGCRGDVTLELSAKAIPMLKFKFTGFYQAPTDTSLPASPDYTKFKDPFPVNKLNTPTMTVHGITGAASNFSIQMNNQIVYRNMIAVEAVDMIERKPSGSVSIEMTSVANKAWHEAVRLGTTGAIQMIHGVGAGNIIQVDAPKVQLTDPSYVDIDGVAMLQLGLEFQPNGSSGNDEISIVVK